jgi:DNA-binding transcriptional ArsR family regulator/prefoldin subunit 5
MAEKSIEIGTDRETGDAVQIPLVEALRGRGFLVGKSGAGKSNSANVLVERILDDGRACMIVDVDGEYYGLKEEYEVLHATGDDEGDLRVGPEQAEKLAEIALEGNVPVILDVSGFLDAEEAEELVGKVARYLFVKAKKLKKPFLLVVEEAHEYIPQQGSPGFAGEHITRIARRGRKHGLGLLGVSQRPASIDKDVLTQANILIWHRLTYENDTNVVRRMYGSEWADEIDDFDDGEALMEYDAWDDVRRIQWRLQETYDAGAAPGLDTEDRPELQTIGSDVLEELEAAGEEARTRQERIERLEAERDELKERVDELERELERAEEYNAFEDRAASALFGDLEDMDVEMDLDLGSEGSIRADVMEVVERAQSAEATIDDLEAERDALQERVDELEERLENIQEERDELQEQIAQVEDLHDLRDDLEELVLQRYSDLFDGDDRVQRLKQRIATKEERIQELEEMRPDELDLEADLLSNEVVRDHVDDVAEECRYSAQNVWDVVVALSALAEGKSAKVREIERQVDLAEKTVLGILNHLAENGIAEKGKDGQYNAYSLDREALEEYVGLVEQRQAIESRSQKLASSE